MADNRYDIRYYRCCICSDCSVKPHWHCLWRCTLMAALSCSHCDVANQTLQIGHIGYQERRCPFISDVTNYRRCPMSDIIMGLTLVRFVMYCRIVLLRFSKSGKRTVSDGFVKKSADSDSVSDSRRRHYKLIYTGHQIQRLSTGGCQMRQRTHVVPGQV